MKSTLFFAITLFSSIVGVLGTPTPGTTNVTTYPTPPGFKPYDVEDSVDASQKPSTGTNNFEAAAATQYWVCEAVSSSTGYYGWSQGKYRGSQYLDLTDMEIVHYKVAQSLQHCRLRSRIVGRAIAILMLA